MRYISCRNNQKNNTPVVCFLTLEVQSGTRCMNFRVCYEYDYLGLSYISNLLSIISW